MAAKKTSFLVADDHEIVRQGVRNILLTQPGWTVCAEAADGREALKMAETHRPDVVILDLTMPQLNGIDATRQLRKICPDTRILIFTMHETERLVQEVFQAGADGYVLKSDAGQDLVRAVNTVLEGRHFYSSRVGELVFAGFLKAGTVDASPADATARLTDRERETVQLLAEGKSNKEVAAILGISVKTAETHRAAIMRKLGLDAFSDLVRYAIRNNIIQA